MSVRVSNQPGCVGTVVVRGREARDGLRDNGVPPHLMVGVTACVEALEEGKYKPVRPFVGETPLVVIAAGTVH